MKRAFLLVMVALLTVAVLMLAVGCGSKDTTSSTQSGSAATSPTTTASDTSAQTSQSTPPDSSATTQAATASQVFEPYELLSADEASEISGFAVAEDEGTLYEDPGSGTISARYAYDLDGTGVHALVEIHQDSFKSGEDIEAGETVLSDFEFEQELSADEITAVDLGEQAFTFDNTGQLHMYYQGYYVVVAFDADPYDSSLAAPLNIKLGERILANLQAALQ
jgi:hypothetical protein